MDIFNVISLLGGLAMFLYGMRLMGDSLKENSSSTFKTVMEKVTNNPFKAFILGLLITCLIQSSTATIVITSGLVAAGILTLRQSLGIIVGANVGTTVTGQIIRLLDLDTSSAATSWLRFFQPSTLAPITLILGIILIMSAKKNSTKSAGNIAIGFGVLFSGLLNMTAAVNTLKESGIVENIFSSLGDNPFMGYLAGAGISFVLQSSSAAVGILQAFSSSGLLTFKAIYPIIVGIYLGDCVTTAIVCSIGAKADARRVGMFNILFNIGKTVLVLVAVTLIHKMGLIDGLWDSIVNSSVIANTNSVFNLTCAIILLPFVGLLEKLSCVIIKDDAQKKEKYQEILDGLTPAFFSTPAIALKSCYNVLLAMLQSAETNIDKSFALLRNFNADTYEEINLEENEIDMMTDRLSRYMVELLPHLQSEDHVQILNQYYKVVAEFERLGDHAVNIADLAEGMSKSSTYFSHAANREIIVLYNLVNNIIDHAESAFKKRDGEAAMQIEPMVRVTSELITQLKQNHFTRMSSGECNIMADAIFSNLMVEIKRITSVCSNIGIATMVRIRPELADHEHLYYESLQKGGDADFDKTFNKIHDLYFSQLELDDGQLELDLSAVEKA
ncbi:MAG: Na/Pi cotransporter family protein [Clostridiales bacterium]|nr:Na/Pi cotransporter family protein [Clostridiales bacterium]